MGRRSSISRCTLDLPGMKALLVLLCIFAISQICCSQERTTKGPHYLLLEEQWNSDSVVAAKIVKDLDIKISGASANPAQLMLLESDRFNYAMPGFVLNKIDLTDRILDSMKKDPINNIPGKRDQLQSVLESRAFFIEKLRQFISENPNFGTLKDDSVIRQSINRLLAKPFVSGQLTVP
jgi:hypothetical protein